jgi:ABC-type branched-subunit amino acid transport system substrate-binding protein
MVTLYKPTAEFIRQMRKAGQMPQFSTLSPIGADLLVGEMGAKDAHGVGISQVMPYPGTTPVVKEYHKAFRPSPSTTTTAITASRASSTPS